MGVTCSGLLLDVALDQNEPRAITSLRKFSSPRPHQRYWRCRFASSSGHEHHALGAARDAGCRRSTHARRKRIWRLSWHDRRFCSNERVSLVNIARKNSIGWPFRTAGWSDNQRPRCSGSKASAATAAQSRRAARRAWRFRTAAAARHPADAARAHNAARRSSRRAERIGIRQGRISARWATRCRGRNPPAR